MVAAVLLDISGVLYDGDSAISGAVAAVQRLQASGLPLRFISNTSQKSRLGLLSHLRDLGFALSDEQLFTAVDAAARWLHERDLRPFCLVHHNIRDEFADFPGGEPNAVFVADAAEGFTYANLNRAFQLCMDGAPLLGVGCNRYFRAGGELLLDAGPFIRALEYAAGVEAVIVGKPSPEFFGQVLDTTGIAAADALMVGDDVFGDVEGALGAGIPACLVRTGKYRAGDEDKVAGDFQVADSIVEVVAGLLPAA